MIMESNCADLPQPFSQELNIYDGEFLYFHMYM